MEQAHFLVLKPGVGEAALDEVHVGLAGLHGGGQLLPALAALLLLEMVLAGVAHHHLATASHLVTLGGRLHNRSIEAFRELY